MAALAVFLWAVLLAAGLMGAARGRVLSLTDLASLRPDRLAFIKYDLRDCDVCAELDPFWREASRRLPYSFLRVSCQEVPHICDAREIGLQSVKDGSPPFLPDSDPQPQFDVWTGARFERYSGLAPTHYPFERSNPFQTVVFFAEDYSSL